jgi:Bardet-Biedl syndrome 4 protein
MCYFEKGNHISVRPLTRPFPNFKAISCMKRAIFLNPSDWIIYYNLGLLYVTMEQYSSAFHYFLVSIKFNSSNAQAYMFLGICLNEMNDSANSFNSFSRAIQLDPENHLIYLNFAIFLAGSENDQSTLAK